MNNKQYENLTGKIFGNWKVINFNEKNSNGQRYWLCECQCDNKTQKSVREYDLIKGLSISCGCLKTERLIKQNRERLTKYNTYNLSGEYGIGYTSKGEEFYFDLEDYDKIKDYCWYISKTDGYVFARSKGNGIRTPLRFHRVILNVSKDKIVDHINHINHDNRKINLRICSKRENNMNKKYMSNSSTGVIGVTWCKKRYKWRARIKLNNKEIHLGYFNDFNDAVKARKEAEEKYFGEYRFIGD